MRRVLKWVGIVLGGLIGVVLIVAIVLYVKGTYEFTRPFDVPTDHVAIPQDDASQARGKEIVTAICTECHGEDLGGQVMVDDPVLGVIYAPNLTAGDGGVLVTHSDDDLVRSIRHGVALGGRGLLIMPSRAFNSFSREDMGSIIAYLRTLAPVDNELPPPVLNIPGRILLASGAAGPLQPAAIIDHTRDFPAMPSVGANAAYGAYFAAFCRECHGPDLTGGPGQGPGAPYAPNLTMSGELIGWSESDFITALSTGVTPSGRKLDPEFMPWKALARLDRDELRGVFMYLKTLNAAP